MIFNGLGQRCFKYFRYIKYYMKYFKSKRNIRDWSKYPLTFPYLKDLQAMEPSFLAITKLISNKIRERFRKGLKQICKLCETDWQKRFLKSRHLLEIPKKCYYRSCLGKLVLILFIFIFGIGNLVRFSSELREKLTFCSETRIAVQQFIFKPFMT